MVHTQGSIEGGIPRVVYTQGGKEAPENLSDINLRLRGSREPFGH